MKYTTVFIKSSDLEYMWWSWVSKTLSNSVSHMIGICLVQLNRFLFVFLSELNI